MFEDLRRNSIKHNIFNLLRNTLWLSEATIAKPGDIPSGPEAYVT